MPSTSVNPVTMLPANPNLNLTASLFNSYEPGVFIYRNSDSNHVPQPSRSLRRGSAVGLMSLAFASTTLTGSFHEFDSIALASEATNELDSKQDVAPIDPSRYRGPSFSLSIPIPHQKEWDLNNYGFIAILPNRMPHLTKTSSISKRTVLEAERWRWSSALRSRVSSYPCPKWTPSELELIMPDIHGPPKPSLPRGHRWPALLVPRNFPDEILLQVNKDNLGQENKDMKRYGRQHQHHKKPAATGKLQCFSL